MTDKLSLHILSLRNMKSTCISILFIKNLPHIAGTTAHVGIKVYGEIAKSQAKHLTKTEAFQRSSIDSFLIASDVNLGRKNEHL